MDDHNKATLVMLSGGLHSLYLLIDLLQNTQQKVYTHHVHLKAYNYNSVDALQSCQQIVDYCSVNYRPFNFSQSMLDYQSLSIDGIQLRSIAYEAALAALSSFSNKKLVNRCIMGGDKNNKEDPIHSQHIQDCFAAANFPNPPITLQQVLITRESALAAVPTELFKIIRPRERYSEE